MGNVSIGTENKAKKFMGKWGAFKSMVTMLLP